MKAQARFDFDKVSFNKENNVNLVLTLSAPPVDWQKRRAPVCVVPVIDVSGSMNGTKLEYAKKSVCKLIEHLQPGDFCGVVVFASEVETLAPPAEMTQARKADLISKVGALQVRDWTNFSGGMCEALERVNKLDLLPGVVVRIIMFTDGQANKGVAIEPDAIVTLAKKVRGRASISAFGYGADANQDMLSTLATACNGNYSFIKNPEDALTAFAKELGGLLSTYAQNIKLTFEPHNGHKITEVVSDVDVSEHDKAVTVSFPEILGEEERNIVVAFRLSEQAQALPRPVNVAEIKVSYELLDGDGHKTARSEELKAKVQFVKPGDEQTKATEEVDRIVGLAQIAKRQIEAEKAADRGDFKGAAATLDLAAADFLARGLGGHVAAVNELKAKMATHDSYTVSSGYRNSFRRATGRGGMSVSSGIEEDYYIPIRGMGVSAQSLQNSAQESLTTSFTSDKDAVSIHTPNASIKIDPDGVKIETNNSVAVKGKKKEKSVAKKRSDRW